ncbi:bifunctional diguanylate cyclase/phosphodiesterase [Sulfurimonas autotrophica]|uniref:Diguanylate cyclase/phosphodiesterase with extracellular sensor n=1 Tax=Sulfurimonas autotrophica (strain ATCC BAA-671 / DSM 16294 / JCM 11897 / OK10) TaxID=563040 RepID=E0UUT4_SULAO|nr:bifunctional diguanylate cyclase/phosphodiesterase [Sulfurimonas autotrophica]ADN08446.1 diguanylate cyclase/phosphodiesterase with extracellular sensor [Sulfurimonas autotrophica DSM 16294]
MKERKFESLSFRIMSSIIITSIIVIGGVFLVFEKINKEAFYKLELQKATLIVKTIEPLLAIDIYLGMENKIQSILEQLMQNKDILSVKVLKDNITLYEIKSTNKYESFFVIKKDILQPNSQKKIGIIVLNYSNHNYKQLINTYTKLLLMMLVILMIIIVLLGMYIKKLLKPLRKTAKLLKDFSPQKKLQIEPIKENNEISLILSALNEMQEKIFDFASKQKDINAYLEKEVDNKTAELRKQLFIDDLTQLPNRRKLFKDIKNSNNNGALLILNIDDFKEINDFYGQNVGDYILIEFAKRLQYLVEDEKNISISRLSGDEFALFFQHKPSYRSFVRVVNTLSKGIEKMLFIHKQHEIYIRVTIGGTLDSKEMLEKADIALKLAKEHRKYFLLYDEKLEVKRQYKENMEWVKKLKSAIKEDRIVPFFQPIFDTQTKEAVSYECLIRLVDTDGSVVSPYKFLGIAKKSKLYPKLTKIMIEKSCQYFQHIDTTFSVNLSIHDILDVDMVVYIQKTMQKYEVSNKIVFEILETEGIDNYEEVSSFILNMKRLGCKISIDDFGSGYSNYEHILKLDIDYIKIDGSLIKNLDTDVNVQIVVETIVDFAKKLNLITIAEFVHNQAVFEKVKALDIERVQGFYLGEPNKEI